NFPTPSRLSRAATGPADTVELLRNPNRISSLTESWKYDISPVITAGFPAAVTELQQHFAVALRFELEFLRRADPIRRIGKTALARLPFQGSEGPVQETGVVTCRLPQIQREFDI